MIKKQTKSLYTYLAMAGLVALIAVVFAATWANAATTYSLVGDATIVAGGNPGNAAQIRSDASIAPNYGGVMVVPASSIAWANLTTLSTDYNVTNDSCGGGSPRIDIKVDTNNDGLSDGNVHVALGPSPSYTGCATGWQSTGNLIGNTDAGRYDYSAFGGSPFTTYSAAPAAVTAGKVVGIFVVADGSWNSSATGGDSEQTVLVDNITVNSDVTTFDAANVTVTIHKYVDGVHATATNANSNSFPMASSWDADNIGSGAGTYTLGPTTYDAQTSSMTNGADYSTHEVTGGSVVGADCSADQPFALVGYSVGDTEALAIAATKTTTAPDLTNITTSKHIIVWNQTCDNDEENVAPMLDNITTPVTIPELSPFTFDANATDADGDTLTFSLVGAPAGATINSSTGVFNWTPTEAQGPGTYTFTVQVSDGSLTDTQSVTINVTEVTDTNPNPNDKDACKNGGWKTMTNPTFKNQGQCVSYMNHH